jgi:opacity protein-like surface antigen
LLKALTAVALLGLPGTALAADLNGIPPSDDRTNLMADPGSDWGFYVQGYGGVVTQNTLSDVFSFDEGPGNPPFTENFIHQLTSGSEFGVSAGVITPIDGLSVGVDVMHTHQDLQSFDEDFGGFSDGSTLDSTSVFATVEGAYHLTPQFDLYATGGLGATSYHAQFGSVFDEETLTDGDTGWTPAYEVAVGLRAKVTDNLSLFTELKHSDVFATAAFAPNTEEGTESIATGHNAVTAGVRFEF